MFKGSCIQPFSVKHSGLGKHLNKTIIMLCVISVNIIKKNKMLMKSAID